MKWLPIETAPRDGTRILLGYQDRPNVPAAVGRFNEDCYNKKPRPYWENPALPSISLCRKIPPTHWMPVPELA